MYYTSNFIHMILVSLWNLKVILGCTVMKQLRHK